MSDNPVGWQSTELMASALPGKSGFEDGDWIEAPYIVGAGIRLIQTGNIGIGEFLEKPEARKFISEGTFRSLRCKWVHPGDILICRLAEPIGRACVVPRHVGDCITAVDCTIYRPDPEKVERNFAIHWLNSPRSLKAAEDIAGGSTRQRISRSNLGALSVPLPPLPEQRRIAEILDTLDEAIRKTEQLIAKLKQVKQGLLHDLLTRGIDANGELRDPERHPQQFKNSQLGRIPKEWELIALGRILASRGGFLQTGPFGSQLHAHEYIHEGGVPVVMPQDIDDAGISTNEIARISSGTADRISRHRLAVNDVVFARRGDLSKCAAIGEREVDWICGTGCLLTRLPMSAVGAQWLSALYRHDWVQRQIAGLAVGSTMVNLNTGILAGLLVALPSRIEQARIENVIHEMDRTYSAENEQLAKLRLLKQGLMEDLLTGRVPVTPLLAESTP